MQWPGFWSVSVSFVVYFTTCSLSLSLPPQPKPSWVWPSLGWSTLNCRCGPPDKPCFQVFSGSILRTVVLPPSTAPEHLWCPPHRSCHLSRGKAECMHASIACLLLYEDYVWVSLGNAMKAKQSKAKESGGCTGRPPGQATRSQSAEASGFGSAARPAKCSLMIDLISGTSITNSSPPSGSRSGRSVRAGPFVRPLASCPCTRRAKAQSPRGVDSQRSASRATKPYHWARRHSLDTRCAVTSRASWAAARAATSSGSAPLSHAVHQRVKADRAALIARTMRPRGYRLAGTIGLRFGARSWADSATSSTALLNAVAHASSS